MKKFTSLFALLACLCVVSAQADVYEPTVSEGETCVFYQVDDHDYYRIYVWDGDGDNATKYAGAWPGTIMDYMGTNANGKNIYKWTTNNNIPSTAKVLFTVNSEQDPNNNKTADLKFVPKGYYVDGNLTSIIGEQEQMTTVYFDNSGTNWSNVRLHAWNNNITTTWPGFKMEKIGNSNVYKCQLMTNYYSNSKLIFSNNGSDETGQFDLVDGKVYSKSGNINVTLEEGKDFPFETSFTANTAHYERSIGVGVWGTLCLPFQISGSNEHVTFYELSSVSSEAMTFAPITSGPVQAGNPVLFKILQGEKLWIDETNVDIDPTPNPFGISGWTMNGTFTKLENQSNVYIIYDQKICLGTSGITINPYRAWFTNTGASGAPLRIEEAGTEGLQYVEQEDGTVKAYYDLQGRKLDGARKGLVIENGKIIMVK